LRGRAAHCIKMEKDRYFMQPLALGDFYRLGHVRFPRVTLNFDL